jgi:hypothetical protein
LGWAPDVIVDSTSAAGTTSDYNDFHLGAPANTPPYNWAGTTYSTISAFQTATAQGGHDLDDPVPNTATSIGGVDDIPMQGSTAIDSANTSAPGALSTDYSGNSPYDDRGALEFSLDHIVPVFTLTANEAETVWPDSAYSTSDKPLATQTVYWGDGTYTSIPFDIGMGGHIYARPGTYTVELVLTDETNQTASTTVTYTTAGNDYTPYSPTRLLDTRSGIGAPVGQIAANGAVHLQIVGAGPADDPIPADVTAVALNITVTDATGSGYITAFADGDPGGVPTVSNVNYIAHQTVPNLAIVPVGPDGKVALFNGGASARPVDLIADVSGYFSPVAAGGYVPLTPSRLVDTRQGTGAPQAQVQRNGTIKVQIAGTPVNGGHIPSAGEVDAVALNVTVTNPHGSGFLTVYPDGTTIPNASNVNYGVGQTVANSVIAEVGSDGEIDVTNGGDSAAGTDVIVDVEGYYDTSGPGTGAYMPLATPVRLLDTRNGAGALPADYFIALAPGVTDSVGNSLSPMAFVLNTTVTDTHGSGFLAVSPDPNSVWDYQNGEAAEPAPPGSSNLNWTPGKTVPNLVQAADGPAGIVDLWNLGASSGPADVIADMFGYYLDV